MILAEILLSFALFLGSSLSVPIDEPKAAEPVDLSFTCIKVTKGNEDLNEHLAPVVLLHALGSFKESWQDHDRIISLRTGRRNATNNPAVLMNSLEMLQREVAGVGIQYNVKIKTKILSDMWRRKRVCVADLRNHGESPWNNVSDIDTMASDLNLLLKSLKTDKVILLGHSLGGKISAHFALKNPEKVEKLIVEDMRPNGATEQANEEIIFHIKVLYDSIPIIAKEMEEKEAKLAVFRYIKGVFEKANMTFILDESSTHLLPIKCSKEKCEFTVNIAVFKKYFEANDYLTLSTGLFDKPALFIYSSLSSFKVGEDKENILKLFPKAKLVSEEGAGHFVHDKPEFTEEVIKFINSEE